MDARLAGPLLTIVLTHGLLLPGARAAPEGITRTVYVSRSSTTVRNSPGGVVWT